jgi:hypothetical protein
VDALQQRVAALALARQELRTGGAEPSALERNRVKLAHAQWELSHALIEKHLAPPVREHAA